MNTVAIDNERYLQRELSSKAILSTDKSVINRYNEQVAVIKRNKQQLSEVAQLKQDVAHLTELVEKLLSKF